MSAPASAQFIFNWDQPRRRSLILIGFIVASFVIHVAASYLFQVVYPQTVSLLPAPRRVSLMTSHSERATAGSGACGSSHSSEPDRGNPNQSDFCRRI